MLYDSQSLHSIFSTDVAHNVSTKHFKSSNFQPLVRASNLQLSEAKSSNSGTLNVKPET